MKRRAVLLLLAATAAVVDAAPASPARVTTVDVLVTAQRYDARMPWRLERPVFRAGYGVAVDARRVVTCEDLVRNATLIEIRQPGKGLRIPCTLVQADPRANAALLELNGRADSITLEPVAWQDTLATGAQVTLAQFDPAGQMQTGAGRVTEISLQPLPSAPHSLLTFSVLTDLKLDRTGAPVLADGRLAGLVMHYDEQAQTSLVLPAAILKTFIQAVDQPPYEGLATAGVFWAPLVDPVKRRYYGLTQADQGVLVLRVIPSSGASGVIHPDDVILEWDGYAVDAQGYYSDPDFGRIIFSHLIAGRRRPGDTVPATLWRDRKRCSVSIKLDSFSDDKALVPLNTEGRQADYLVEGGLILRELSYDYLAAYGPRWMITANPRLANLYLTRAQFPEHPGDRVVILAAIVPDDVNKGYQGYRDDVVTRINGQPIANLKDVMAIRERDGGIWRIATQSHGVDIVLDPEQLAAANRRVSDRYRIPRLRVIH